ncbi:MAG: regulatory protein RecX [Woeseiaceae bacterium]
MARSKPIRTVRVAAMDYLSRREHATQELFQKLNAKEEYEADDIHEALSRLIKQDLLNDQRFTESFIQQRLNRGSGPLKIRAELRQKGVSDAMIGQLLDERDTAWRESARSVRLKKYGTEQAKDMKEKAKQNRFLQSRGFSSEQIRYAMLKVDISD